MSAKMVNEIEQCNEEYSLYSINHACEQRNLSQYNVGRSLKKFPDHIISVIVKGVRVDMVVDSAADVSTLNEAWVFKNLKSEIIQRSEIKLHDYNKRAITVVGTLSLPVTYNKQNQIVNFAVVQGNKPCLFGKDCMNVFKLDWNKFFSINEISVNNMTLQALLSSNSVLFGASYFPIKRYRAKILLKDGVQPVFKKARLVPYALRPAVEDEINLAKQTGVWKPVEHCTWATPLVTVPKKDGKVRLCGDFKVTLNPYIIPDSYPLPTQQDLFSALNGGIIFSKLDMKHAYQQVELDKDAQEYLTLNTHVGLMRPTRMLYGITNASAIFQSIMDKILQGLQNVICYQDDILVMGISEDDHLKTLSKVFTRLNEFGVKLNPAKCLFLQTNIEYLGHIVDRDGIHPTDEKIEAIKSIASPQDVSQLRSFLGLLNYYIKFIPDSATLLHPLHALLHKDEKWAWTEECESVFQKCKNILTSETVLVHYDPIKPLKLFCDASPYGVGTILAHSSEETDRPVAYASRTLSKAEKGYSQVEREALAIVFGLKKFQQYLFGRPFTIVTDHKPLLTLFGPKTAVPALAAARIQRWALLLASFNYTIEYKKGVDHTNVDALSRLPMSSIIDVEGSIFKLSYLDELPVSSSDISVATRNDADLGRVMKYILYGWPSIVDKCLYPFEKRKDQLSVDNECVLWGMRVIIPRRFRSYILELLHDTHPGMTKMKSIARSHVWWPCLDEEIERMVSSCFSCAQSQHMPSTAPLQSWTWPKTPWERVHVDFAQKGPHFFLIVVDGHSKWLEVMKMPSTTSKATIDKCRELFARYGVPVELVSDNGPQLTALQFRSFLANNGVRHTLVPTYHPQSNGSAERAVQMFKMALEKMNNDDVDDSPLEQKIDRFLLVQHSTKHSTTGCTPAKLFLGREIRNRWSLLHSKQSQKVEEMQMRQKLNFDRTHTTERCCKLGERVLVRNYGKGPKWSYGTVSGRQSSKTWKVIVNGAERMVHIDQIRPTKLADKFDELDTMTDNVLNGVTPAEVLGQLGENGASVEDSVDEDNARNNKLEFSSVNDDLKHVDRDVESPTADMTKCEAVAERRNPPRLRRKPERLNL